VSAAKHTPGPWFPRLESNSPLAKGANFQYSIYWRDMTFVGGRERRLDNRCGEFSEADARLIAAAPELLEAARVMLATFNVRGLSIPVEAGDALVAAIAKATGGQQ